MIEQEKIDKIQELHALGIENVAISRAVGCDKATVKKYLNYKDELINKKIGKLTIIKRVSKPEHRSGNGTYYECECECGRIITVAKGDLTRKNRAIKSCGSCNNEKSELGKRYGKLTVIDSNFINKKRFWICKCDCGNIVQVRGNHLRGGTSSCGCVKSFGEQKILSYLLQKRISFIKEYSFKDLKSNNNGNLKFDFAIFNKENKLMFLIEFQGEQHFKDCGEFGKIQREKTDKLKYDYCIKNNIKIYYINYNENIIEKMEEILKDYPEVF